MNNERFLDRIHFLKTHSSSPEAFREEQNELLYRDGPAIFQRGRRPVNNAGLSAETDSFYQREEAMQPAPLTLRLPRVLNIGSGAESTRKLPAINTDVSGEGKPEVIADGKRLPFKDGTFSVVRASHILEHIDQDDILPTLLEWKRVLHSQGELQIAVPDADIAFQEILDGQTPKGKPAFSATESTAPLAQIYGLGYDNPNTDPRWLHKIIFNYVLLKHYLELAGFGTVETRTKDNDIAAFSNIDDDSQNHYSLLVSARNERQPHPIESVLPEKAFRQRVSEFKKNYPEQQVASFIIPVCNEEKNLPHFLSFLEASANQTDTKREFIFVVNGSCDNSEAILRKYIPQSMLNMRMIHSEKGITKAFVTGIKERMYEGMVGKIDADTLLHPHALDLMQMYLTENSEIQATYAEPTPIDSQFSYNEAEHNPPIRSQRLYIHGRLSLYRNNPFAEIVDKNALNGVQVEDIFLSFYYAYYYGLDSIHATPHAVIYSKTVKNFDDLVKQLSRNAGEMERVFGVYPPFQALDRLLEREIYSGDYHDTVKAAKELVRSDISDWTRLSSTK